jgi:hypothetical protein
VERMIEPVEALIAAARAAEGTGGSTAER